MPFFQKSMDQQTMDLWGDPLPRNIIYKKLSGMEDSLVMEPTDSVKKLKMHIAKTERVHAKSFGLYILNQDGRQCRQFLEEMVDDDPICHYMINVNSVVFPVLYK